MSEMKGGGPKPKEYPTGGADRGRMERKLRDYLFRFGNTLSIDY